MHVSKLRAELEHQVCPVLLEVQFTLMYNS